MTARSGADDYERRYMGADAPALHRERVHGRPWYQALFAASGLALAAVPLLTDAPAAAALPGLVVLGLSWALLSVLRTTVTARAVHVQLGPFGPTIPIAAIERVDIVALNVLRHGYGIHRTLGGTWCYTLPVDGGGAVQLAWRDARGRRRSTMVSSAAPEVLKAAIERARAQAVDLEAARLAQGLDAAPVARLAHDDEEDEDDGARPAAAADAVAAVVGADPRARRSRG